MEFIGNRHHPSESRFFVNLPCLFLDKIWALEPAWNVLSDAKKQTLRNRTCSYYFLVRCSVSSVHRKSLSSFSIEEECLSRCLYGQYYTNSPDSGRLDIHRLTAELAHKRRRGYEIERGTGGEIIEELAVQGFAERHRQKIDIIRNYAVLHYVRSWHADIREGRHRLFQKYWRNSNGS